MLDYCGTTLWTKRLVTFLSIRIDRFLDVFAAVRVMSKEHRIMEQALEDKLEGGCDTERMSDATISVVLSFRDVSLGSIVENEPWLGDDKSLDPLVEAEPSMGSGKTMDQPKTECRLHKAHKEGISGEELSAAPLSRRAARKARKATSKAALISNVSMAEGASRSSEETKKASKRGRGARKKDPAPPAVGSDYSDTSVVAGPSNIKPAVSLKPGFEAKATEVTVKARNQADNPGTCVRRPIYPPELESFYKKARKDQVRERLAQQSKAALVGAKSTKEKNMVAAKIYDPIDKIQAEVGGDGTPVASRGLQWKPASALEIQAPTRENVVVGGALGASIKSRAFKKLGVGDGYDFSESAQQWWNRHQPSTDSRKGFELSTIEALDLYGDHVRNVMQCRANLDLRRRAHSAARSRLGSASITLQCLVRHGTYRTNFWRSRQQSAEMEVRAASKALRKARKSEARVLSMVSP